MAISTTEQAGEMLAEQFKRAILAELQLLDVRCESATAKAIRYFFQTSLPSIRTYSACQSDRRRQIAAAVDSGESVKDVANI